AAMTKYNSTDGLTSLQAVDDAASVNMGGAWHMPTSTQISELLNTAYVTNQSVTNYQGSGVSGTLYTSVVDNSQTLFFPISRYCADGEFNYRNESALIWSQSLKNNDVIWGRTLTNENLERFLGQNHRYAGLVVRGVIG
ncbi:MAG: hypothetical protein J6Y37_14690, partial [Paludibacteraceae bacterium]|nr:hypothetical protein [Paludibacteraceae bacterium]